MSLRMAFAGTPDFSREILQSLLKTSHTIVGVFTQPDRPKGRGQHLQISPVKQLALRQDLPIFQPSRFRDKESYNLLKELKADVFVVVAYGLILPKEVLSIPKYGCINIHASLLPHWRGAAPIQRAILAGDSITGITIMQMDEGLDTGDILASYPCPIEIRETSESLYRRLATIGSDLLINTLDQLEKGTLVPQKQDNAIATVAKKLEKKDAKIDWAESAIVLDRKIRAFNPWPIAYTSIDSQNLRIFAAEPKNTPSITPVTPGTIVYADAKSIEVATGDGLLSLTELQLPGGKRLSAAALLNGKPDLFKVGNILGRDI